MEPGFAGLGPHAPLALDDLLPRIPGWLEARERRVTPLDGGATNRIFRVDLDGEALVLRIPGRRTGLLGIVRDLEHAATLRAAAAGIGPEAVTFLELEGCLVTRFLEGRPVPVEEVRTPERLCDVADLLREVHALHPVEGSFCPLSTAEAYLRGAAQLGVPAPARLGPVLARMREVRAALDRVPFTPRLCHNDLLNGNLLHDGGRLRLLDWEYAAMGHPAFDLANFSVNHQLTDDEDAVLLARYHGSATPVARARHRLLRDLSDLREATWNLLQAGVSELGTDYAAAADEYFERLERSSSAPDYPRWLAEAAAG